MAGSLATGAISLKPSALQVCDLERQQYGIEQQILQMLQLPEFEAYHKIFDSFDFGPMTRAVVLSRIYPFDRFLRPDGRPIVEWVYSASGKRTKRKRSLNRFRLALGMGTVVKQSGNAFEQVAGGASYARKALFCHVKTKIVMQGKYAATPYRAAHCRFYAELGPDVPHRLAVMKTASKITTDLFKALLKALP